jgi:hypothetical protein
MAVPSSDQRSPARRALDEQIAAESQLPAPKLPAGTTPSPIETHLARIARRPVAVAGIVENGMARPLDPAVKLAERSRVIIVTAENS